jgi:hypothetical protein
LVQRLKSLDIARRNPTDQRTLILFAQSRGLHLLAKLRCGEAAQLARDGGRAT